MRFLSCVRAAHCNRGVVIVINASYEDYVHVFIKSEGFKDSKTVLILPAWGPIP